MAARKFCVMTEGRSGSTSLMEALELFDDIALPNKNIKCPDNELVHPRQISDYCKQYARLCQRDISTGDELIEAFYEFNDKGSYYYAGFKTMPNRHPDFAGFTSRKDIRFITLKRRDIASTTASFMLAMSKGTWRRHGEEANQQWLFNVNTHGEAVRSNLAYIHASHQQMDAIAGAISLFYEDLCDPDYRNTELNGFFMRQVTLRDPQPPTSGASYVTNWDEFRSFVETYWHDLTTSGQTAVSKADVSDQLVQSAPGTHIAAAGNGPDGSSISLYCQFVGAPVSGATLVMALLNAHPDIVIGHEVDVLAGGTSGQPELKQVVPALVDSVAGFVAQGCIYHNNNFSVSGQWQGRYRRLLVAGEDTAAAWGLRFREQPGLVTLINRQLGVPLKFIHVYRNPFDVIPALLNSGIDSIRKASGLYFSMAEGVQAVRNAAGAEAVFDLCIEDFYTGPEKYLQQLCAFLGVECDEQYLLDCRSTVLSLKPLTLNRKLVGWKSSQIEQIRKHMQQFEFFQRYTNDRDIPQPTAATTTRTDNKELLADIQPAAQKPAGRASVGRTITGRKSRDKRIVYAWELGMDLGHIMRFLPLALKLRERGHEVVFAIRDLQHAESVIGRQGFDVLQAPIWQQLPKNLKNPPLNYAEIILRYGFLTEAGLTGLVKAWRNLYRSVGAGLVIADHAPSALLAARTLDLKRITIGHGFFSPPAVSPTPNMRPWLKIPDKRLESSDKIALDNANHVIEELGGSPIKMLSELFRVDAEFLCTFRELDHYPGRQGARYWGPGFNVEEGVDVAWPPGKGRRIFAYIKPSHRDFERLLTSLQQAEARVLAYIPGISEKMAEKYATPRLIISHKPVRLQSVRYECDLAICHAGIGTVSAVLLAGKPLLLLPNQLEQYLVARRIEELGAGLVVNADIKDAKPDYPSLLKRLLQEATFRQAAQAFAKKYGQFQPEAQYRAMANVVEKLLQK